MAKGIDWDFIRSEFEETTKSIRQIARENHISHGAIQRRAKMEEWKKFDEKIVRDRALIKKRILGKVALRKIQEIKDELGENYSALDEPLIAILATNYELWIQQMQIVQEEGLTAISSKGSEYVSANFNALLPLQKSIIAISNQLGLSIASRKKIGLDVSDKKGTKSLFDIAAEIENIEVDV